MSEMLIQMEESKGGGVRGICGGPALGLTVPTLNQNTKIFNFKKHKVVLFCKTKKCKCTRVHVGTKKETLQRALVLGLGNTCVILINSMH